MQKPGPDVAVTWIVTAQVFVVGGGPGDGPGVVVAGAAETGGLGAGVGVGLVGPEQPAPMRPIAANVTLDHRIFRLIVASYLSLLLFLLIHSGFLRRDNDAVLTDYFAFSELMNAV